MSAASVMAQNAVVISNADECLKAAFALASEAEKRQLQPQALEKLDELLTKIEAHCDANEFDEAKRVHAEIKTLIGIN